MLQNLRRYQKRKKIADGLLLGGFTGIVLGFVLIFALEERFFIGWLILMLGFLSALLGEVLFKVFQYTFKNEFLKDYINEGFDSVRYMPIRGRTSSKLRYVLLDFLKLKARQIPHGLYQNEVEQTGFVPVADGGFFSSDYLEGKFGEVAFVASDVKTQARVHNPNNNKTSYQTLFHGRVFRFDFNKPIDGTVLVLERYQPTGFLKYEKVQMESVAFNKTFNVHTTKPQTAFYVLTPHFMERLQDIEKNHPGNIGFSFIDAALYFAIHTGRDTFAFRHFKKLDETLLEKMQDDVKLLGELIEDLRLNDQIFLSSQIPNNPLNAYALPTDATWAKHLHPTEVSRKIIESMVPVESETPKGKSITMLKHTDLSKVMLDTYSNSLDEDTCTSFERVFAAFLKVEQMKVHTRHGFETMSGAKLGCLTIIVLIVAIIMMFIFSPSCTFSTSGVLGLGLFRSMAYDHTFVETDLSKY